MKRRTLLLAVALLLQGSTSWAVLSNNTPKLSKAQRRAARKARQEAREAEQQVAAAHAESASAFELTFGKLPNETSDNNSADLKTETPTQEAVAAQVAQAVAAAQKAMDSVADSKPEAEIVPIAQTPATSTNTESPAKGWFSFGTVQTNEERHAAALRAVLPAVAAKAQVIAEARNARTAQKALLPRAAIQAAAKAMKQSQTKIPANEIYQEQDERGMLPLLKEVKAKAQAVQKSREANPFQEPYKAVAVEYDSDLSDVEGKDTEEYSATQKHYSTWTKNLRDPRVLLAHLKAETIAPEYQQHFESLVASALSLLVEQAEANIHGAAKDNVNARRECAKANAVLMETLNAIARQARIRKLNLAKASKKMALAFQTLNDSFVEKTADMARAEITNTQIVLNDEDFRFATAARVIKRAKRTKHACLQGEQGSDNLAILTRAIATLTRQLEAGSADIETVASLLDLLNSPKDIHVAPYIITRLHEAIATVATQNNNEAKQELTQAVALNARLNKLASEVAVYAKRFTDNTIISALAETDFLKELDGYLATVPSDDTRDGDWN